MLHYNCLITFFVKQTLKVLLFYYFQSDDEIALKGATLTTSLLCSVFLLSLSFSLGASKYFGIVFSIVFIIFLKEWLI